MTSPHHVLILGGARSGKSARGLALASAYRDKIFIATAQAHDEEMAQRIARHQTERGLDWDLLECPLDLTDALAGLDDPTRVILVDCVTLWLSNLMFKDRDVEAELTRLCQSLPQRQSPIIFISNEVGLGLVPETPLGRAFRDHQGRANQALAQVCDHVEFIAAGLPLVLKTKP